MVIMFHRGMTLFICADSCLSAKYFQFGLEAMSSVLSPTNHHLTHSFVPEIPSNYIIQLRPSGVQNRYRYHKISKNTQDTNERKSKQVALINIISLKYCDNII